MENCPRGPVTLLFTDMENSTRLVSRLGAAFAGLLNEVRSLLRATVASLGGFEVDAQGDACFFVFEDCCDAVRAAAKVQRAMLEHNWPGEVRVRMALHSGEPIWTKEGYVGIDVHIAARICAVGHGGQVLLSKTAQERVVDILPSGLSLKEVGTHHLKDLPRAEKLFQLVGPELPADFPPLRSLGDFADQLSSVVKALDDGRLVVVLGDGANLCRPSESPPWRNIRGAAAPTDTELAGHLAAAFGYPLSAPQELARVSQHAAVTAGPGPLYEEMHACLVTEFCPSPLHELVASIPALLRQRTMTPSYPLILTTNYDDALESAFAAIREPYDLVSYIGEGEHRGKFSHRPPDGRPRLIDKPNKYLGLSLDERTVIMKFHGSFDRSDAERDSFVLTEDDYFDYLPHADLSNAVPVLLSARLRRSHLLFLGCNLREWTQRMLLHRLWGNEKLKYKSWAIHANAESVDYQYWHQHDIEVLDISLDDYVSQLAERTRLFIEEERGLEADAGALGPRSRPD